MSLSSSSFAESSETKCFVIRLRENDVVISLAMHCWMNMFTFPPNGQHALAALLDPESSHPFMAPPNTLQKAVKAVTIDMIAVLLKEALSSEEMILWPLNYASPIWSLRMLPTELAHKIGRAHV